MAVDIGVMFLVAMVMVSAVLVVGTIWADRKLAKQIEAALAAAVRYKAGELVVVISVDKDQAEQDIEALKAKAEQGLMDIADRYKELKDVT